MKVRSTTIIAVRRDGKTAMAGDGQVSIDDTIVKGSAQKVRTMRDGEVIAGYAGAALQVCVSSLSISGLHMAVGSRRPAAAASALVLSASLAGFPLLGGFYASVSMLASLNPLPMRKLRPSGVRTSTAPSMPWYLPLPGRCATTCASASW